MPAQAALRGAVMVDLGDWYLTANKLSRAQETWREAWKELRSGRRHQPARQAGAGDLRRTGRWRCRRHQRDPAEHSEQPVQIRLAIDANGRVREATVANPAPEREAAEKAVMGAARSAIWRPAFRDGAPVAADDHLFT